MAEYSDENKGILFNEDVKKSERAPDWTGKANVQCLHCGESNILRLAAWERTTKTGKPILSLAVSELKDVVTEKTQTGYEKARETAQTLRNIKQDVVIEDIGDEPIDLDDIPF